MARTNKLKQAIQLIENEICEAGKKIVTEAQTEHYGKACGWQNYQEGLVQALCFVKVCSCNAEGEK